MYMKTGDSASPGSAIKLHGIVSYLIVPLKMFIYGKKDQNNLRCCSLEFAKIIICQKKKKKDDCKNLPLWNLFWWASSLGAIAKII